MLRKNLMILSRTRIFQNLYCSLLLISVLCLFSCGYKDNPRIPYRDIPQRVTSTDIAFIGDTVYLRIFVPRVNEKGEKRENLTGLYIYRKSSEITKGFQEKKEEKQEEKPKEPETTEISGTRDTSSIFKQKSEKTQTQEAFGFGREMSMPGSNITNLGAIHDFEPVDFQDNYALISELDIAEDGSEHIIYADSIDELLDEGQADPVQVSYVIRTVNSEGRYSKFSNIFQKTAFFTPEPPENISCMQTDAGIEIKWDKCSSVINGADYSDQILYSIYRAENEAGIEDPFLSPINQEPSGSLSYTDNSYEDSRKLYYSVRSVLKTDIANFSSVNSKSCFTEIISEIEKRAVEGVLILAEHESAILLWKPFPGENIKGYNIYRKHSTEKEFTLVNPQPVISYRFQDNGLKSGIYSYYITAVLDTDPVTESQPSAAAEIEIK